MSVEPGFGGQAFMPESLNTVRALVEMRERHGLDFEIEIDGGINMSNIADVVEAGVDVVVAGSAIFGADDPAEAVKAFKNA
jgi:ribulose-phosphate 3-epimerase